MRKLLVFIVSSASMFATAFTSTKAGAWSDPTTWGNAAGGAVPGQADTMTINHAVTLDSNRTTGNCQAFGSGIDAIKINAGGTLTWATNAALTVQGNISATNTSTTVMAIAGAPGAQLLFDPSCGNTTTLAQRQAAQYKLTFAGNPSGGKFEGSTGNHAVIKTLRPNLDEARAYQDYTGAGVQGWRTLQYVDFTDFGDATHEAISTLSTAAATDFTYSNNTFASCGRTVFTGSAGSSGNWRFNYNRFTTPLNTYSITITPSNTPGASDVREVAGNDFGGVFATSLASTGLDIHHNVFRSRLEMYAFGTTTVKAMQHNLFAPPNAAPFTAQAIGTLYGVSDFNNNYIATAVSVAPRNFLLPDGTSANALSQSLTDNIAEIINPATADGSGYVFSAGPVANGSPFTYEFKRNLVLHTNGTNFAMTFLVNPPRFSTIEHNTLAAGGAATAPSVIRADTGPAWVASGDVEGIRSNIFWAPSGSTQYKFYDFAHPTSAGPSNLVAPTSVGWNASFNMKLTSGGGYPNAGNGYQANLSAAIGTGALAQQSDLDNINPQFVDPTRNIGTYWTAGLSQTTTGSYFGNAQAAINYIAADPVTRIPAMMTWVRDGYKVQNAALHGTAHDAGDVGALAFVFPATNPGILGRVMVADSQISHPGLDAGVN